MFTATLVDWPKISCHFLDQSEGGLEIKANCADSVRIFPALAGGYNRLIDYLQVRIDPVIVISSVFVFPILSIR